MEKVILLKTQLAEAALLAKKRTYPNDRLAVILLDNFVEIQLSSIMKNKFDFDGTYNREKKYSFVARKKILNNYDDLLRACVEEKVIESKDLRLLTFCHAVRNNLYHKGGEEKPLTRIALSILHDLILNYQSTWKSTRIFTSWGANSDDPYKRKDQPPMSGNSREDWGHFLNTYFTFLDHASTKPAIILSEFLLEKIYDAKGSFQFIRNDFSDFYPGTEDWIFNDFVREFSFLTRQKHEIAVIKENPDKAVAESELLSLRRSFRDNWRFKKEVRLDKLEEKVKTIAELPISECLEKYNSLKDEIFMFNEALGAAAVRLDGDIQLAMDIARGK